MLLTIDYLQFTVTSSCELPTTEFAVEIRKAAEDIYELFSTRDEPKRQPMPADKSTRHSEDVAGILGIVLWLRGVLKV